jgi:hypothetical protein
MRIAFAPAAAACALAGCAPAAPPAATAPSSAQVFTVPLGARLRSNGLGIVPRRIEEDSRCPASVRCIQAGTVRLAVDLSGAGAPPGAVLTLGTPLRIRDRTWLTLARVCPARAVPGPIPAERYRVTLVASPTADGGRAAAPLCR